DEAVEIVRRLEVLVYAGKSHVCDRVDPREAFHHDLADGLRRDVGVAQAFQAPHDPADHLIDAFRVDGALLHRDADRTFQLGTVEILALARGFDDDKIAQLDPFIGGEPATTGRAKATTADRHVILRGPRVLHLRVDVAAEWAAHRPPPCLWLYLPQGRVFPPV